MKKIIPTVKKQPISRRYVDCSDDKSEMSDFDPESLIDDEDLGNKPNQRFTNNKYLFESLLKTIPTPTKYPIVNATILQDSSRVLTVTKASEQEYYIKMYDMETQNMVFEEEYFGNYIKMKEVEQNRNATKFAVAFNDDGLFKIRTFGRTAKSIDEIIESEVNVNDILGIDEKTMAVSNFPDPFITICFVSDDKLFVNLFYNYTCTHYHFFYDVENKKAEGITSFNIGNSKKNFPYKSFYNDEENEVYSFYRQGQAITIPVDGSPHRIEKMTDLDLGSMYLFQNRALIARTSSEVSFFKIFKNPEDGKKEWRLYHKLPIRGFLFYMKGNVRI